MTTWTGLTAHVYSILLYKVLHGSLVIQLEIKNIFIHMVPDQWCIVNSNFDVLKLL
jgi:hypothetical protein